MLEAELPGAGEHVFGVSFEKTERGEHGEWHGPATLHIDEHNVATDTIRTQPGHFALCGEGLCIGYDSGDRVSKAYEGRGEYSGGEIKKVVFDVADDAYVDVERAIAAGYARD